MRQVVLDTETTGLKPQEHRLVEFAAVELINMRTTGKNLRFYINPERDIPEAAFKIHGLSLNFLSKHPIFAKQIPIMLDFIQQSPLVIHNAPFDLGFLKNELALAGCNSLTNPIVDTLVLARQKFPGSPANLDALCRRFKIKNDHRQYHGALIDAQLLAQVYLHLKGRKQMSLLKENSYHNEKEQVASTPSPVQNGQQRVFVPSPQEKQRHDAMVAQLDNALWQQHAFKKKRNKKSVEN